MLRRMTHHTIVMNRQPVGRRRHISAEPWTGWVLAQVKVDFCVSYSCCYNFTNYFLHLILIHVVFYSSHWSQRHFDLKHKINFRKHFANWTIILKMFGSEQKIKKSNLTAVQVLYIQKLCVRVFERLKPLVKVS